MNRSLGRPRLHLRSTVSTNDRARALAVAGARHGTLVTASAQTAGRGRQGRVWSAPAGSSLLMSLVLRDPPALLSLAAAVAVCDAIGGAASGHPQGRLAIKWPNDVVLADPPIAGARSSATAGAAPPARAGAPLAKLGGILVEGRPQEGWAVLGIGLNVAVRLDDLPAEIRGGAATLGLDSEQIEPLLTAILDALAHNLAAPSSDVLGAWRAKDALRGRQVTWADGEGIAEGIDGEGRLLVRRADGALTALAAGEVHLER